MSTGASGQVHKSTAAVIVRLHLHFVWGAADVELRTMSRFARFEGRADRGDERERGVCVKRSRHQVHWALWVIDSDSRSC